MPAPKALIELIRDSNQVFIKTENYVPAHITATNPKGTIGEDWSEDKMRDYLYSEAMLNNSNGGAYDNGRSISIFVGDAKYHSWVQHFKVTKVTEGSLWTYQWELVK
jgi:hypothetical protein